ncbi:AbrB/MazE/SpoVT family DNA-binding domain-containing protein [Synechococcus sp. BA-132 BA5]|uniref:AbrB/MazE/SpoVT family DNA-binding domain-containing protein n=1 Tax=Synechococcus sp. BA-132 BA5 TaxID=3110252 RepID=UPI002B201902|nr:AbrB/MazE/SpoVT family DNA-binding domain-containing protein [Synechococcus sp. BA-132 BA5]MEA5416407.1 AbrB/MazE/SpoVT family DNA-binding domain-containing protein [Synechococcus sp. BA-132 BA5]
MACVWDISTFLAGGYAYPWLSMASVAAQGVFVVLGLLEEAGLTDEVDIHVAPGVLTITPVAAARAGWAEAAAAVAPEGLLDVVNSTRFDDGEWEW